jgi:hypothetical protein
LFSSVTLLTGASFALRVGCTWGRTWIGLLVSCCLLGGWGAVLQGSAGLNVAASAGGLSEDSAWNYHATTAREQGNPKQGDRGELSRGEALVQTVLPYFCVGLMTFASVGLSFDYFVSRDLIFGLGR